MASRDRRSQMIAAFLRTPPPDGSSPPKFPHALGNDPNKGQYRIPGLGEWGKQQNIRKLQQRNRKTPRSTGPDWNPNNTRYS